MFARPLKLIVIVALLACQGGRSAAQSGRPSAPRSVAGPASGASAVGGAPTGNGAADPKRQRSAELDGVHDMVLLLPEGPMHLRVRITEGGKSLKAKRDEYMSRLVATLDVDKDGKLSSTETSKHPLFVTGRRFEGNKFLESLKSRKPFSDRELVLAVERAAGQLMTYRQNNSLNEQDLAVFRVLDEDQSGLIERLEMRTSTVRIAARDADFDQCITFDEFLEQAAQDPGSVIVAAIDEPPGSVHSDMLRDANEPILAQRLVRRYDTDRDAHLSAKELGWPEERCQELDSDRDGSLTVQELSALMKSEPDLSMDIDLSAPGDQAMRIDHGRLGKQLEQARSDVIKLKHKTGMLTIGYQARDLMAESERNTQAAFNAIDVDANGYLDRDEIVDHQRFERYLFDGMDTNDDDRVFADEMLAYVRAYTEPATMTCQATLLDAGNGFFQILDDNGDGRISIRELRQCESLLLAQSDEQQQINPSRMTKSYRIVFQRGGVSLFGRVSRPQAETPEALLRAPSGPIWFQRMDRNSDGDLVWDEFLGPREAFHQLDRDGDNLVSTQEASEYERRQTTDSQ